MENANARQAEVIVRCAAADAFADWIGTISGSIVVTTYQAGKVAFIGWDGRQVTLLMRDFPKPLGLAIEGDRMAVATREEMCLFANAGVLAHDFLPDAPGRYDALYLPRATYYTGDLHIHDIAFGSDGLWLVNTRFSCLARLSDRYSFQSAWRPQFVSDMVPEDRCHLNGLAMRDGVPAYVTALGQTNVPGGWRKNKSRGGILIDVAANDIVLGGLCMPHSPRWHDGRLWLLNSGAGELLVVDPRNGQTEAVCGLSGYLRGLAFVGPYAVIGMSRIREEHIFGGLPVQTRNQKLQCGVAVVDLRSGTPAGLFEFIGGCTELYDVQFLPGIRRPMILSGVQPAHREAITNPESSYWIRSSAMVPEANSTLS